MRKLATIILLALAAVTMIFKTSTTTTSAPQAPPAIVLSSAIPGDAQFGSLPPNATNTEKLLAIQGDFDIYSWNTFIALNWPPGPDGNGDPKKTIGQSKSGDNDTVWEHYRDVADIFLPGGATPSYKGQTTVPAQCKASFKPGMRILSQVGKTPTVLTDFSQPFNTGPLIDQNGIYTRYEILVNKTMFDYILGNALYSKAGQKGFAGAVKFPCGVLGGPEGAIMVKSSWKVISPADQSRFHTQTVLVYTQASQNPKYAASCSTKLMGLVGLHIGHKTNSGAQWLWSTFEHVDNAPSEADVASGKLKSTYNYYNPKCTAANCPPNQVPPRPWNPQKVSSFHSQVVRMNMFKGNEFAFTSAAARNADALTLLTGVSSSSVWQNYELISTMWPTNTGKCQAVPGDPLGTPAPNFLANTTLETYIQGMVPNVSSNCIECHNNATMTTPVPSDFTYILQRAK
jgi:hypothetical protein